MLPPVHNVELESLQADLSWYPRMDGFYILELVSISDLRHLGASQDVILDKLAEQWTDRIAEQE